MYFCMIPHLNSGLNVFSFLFVFLFIELKQQSSNTTVYCPGLFISRSDENMNVSRFATCNYQAIYYQINHTELTTSEYGV